MSWKRTEFCICRFIWGSFYEKSKPSVSSKRIPAFLMSNEVTKEAADVITNTLNSVILYNAERCPMYSCDETSQRYAVWFRGK